MLAPNLTVDILNGTNDSYKDPNMVRPWPIDYWSFGSYQDPDGIFALRLSLYGVVIPAISVVGILANILNVIILSKLAKKKKTAIYNVLLAMAVADIFVCISYLANSAVLYMRADPLLIPEKRSSSTLGMAGYVVYLSVDPISGVSGFISNWCTVVMAAFRFIAVYFPLHASQWCTRLRVRIAIVTVTVTTFIVILPSRLLLIASIVGSGSFGSTSKQSLRIYSNIVHPIINDVVPWLLCLILVCLLLASLYRNTDSIQASCTQKHQRQRNHSKLTVLLLSTATWFVVTTAPSTVSIIMSFFSDQTVLQSAYYKRLFLIGQVLVLLNFTGNFFFYSCMNKRHRQQLQEMMPAQVHTHWRTQNQQSMSSSASYGRTGTTTAV